MRNEASCVNTFSPNWTKDSHQIYKSFAGFLHIHMWKLIDVNQPYISRHFHNTADLYSATPIHLHKRQSTQRAQNDKTVKELNFTVIQLSCWSTSATVDTHQRFFLLKSTITLVPIEYLVLFVLIYGYVLELLSVKLLIWNKNVSFIKCSLNWCVTELISDVNLTA